LIARGAFLFLCQVGVHILRMTPFPLFCMIRRYAQKSEHGTAMLQAGITFCLIFNERSLDLGADSVAQRDFLVLGAVML